MDFRDMPLDFASDPWEFNVHVHVSSSMHLKACHLELMNNFQ